jgi:hypothetical protein
LYEARREPVSDENGAVAETLAVAGTILLLLAVTGGIEGIATKLFQKEQFIPLGDRIAATLLGGALIGLAAVLETGSHRWGLWIALGVGSAVVLWYASFLGREHLRNRRT